MNYIIKVIDRAFIRWEEKDSVLTISKPGFVENGIYYPPESVTLFGENVASELLNLAREIQKERIGETNGVQSTKFERGTGESLPEISNRLSQNPTNPINSKSFNIQDICEDL